MSDKGYRNPDLLWSPDQLQARLSDSELCIVDTRSTQAYVAGHISGALPLDVYGISLTDTREQAFNAFLTMYQYFMGSRGIGTNYTVVFYEEDSGMRAARGFWFCEYLGHQNVHVLDGGIKAWTAAGNEVTTECKEPGRGEFKSERVPERHIDVESLRDALGDPDTVVLDTRSEDEYYGKLVRAARGGAIPGAVHIEYVNNLDATGGYKPAAELREMYERAGVTPEKTVVCY